MTAAPDRAPARVNSPVEAALARSGFCFEGKSWARGDLRYRKAGRWAVLETPLDPANVAPNADLGKLGLWRTVTERGGGRRVFELPDSILALADDGFSDDDEDPFTACLSWALLTAEGKVPDDWKPETRESLDVIVPKNRLTVLAGTSVRQGELIHTPHQLALRFPIVPVVPVDLPARRLAYLRAALRDVQNGWSLIRLGLAGNTPRSVLAEIDLTGAPAAALAALISASLDSLHNVILRFVETAEVLMDAEVASVALDSAAFPIPTKDQQNDHDH